MSSFHARKAALDMALRHHGPGADLDTIFHTADHFVEYLNRDRVDQQRGPQPCRRFTDAQIKELFACSKDPLTFMERVKIQHPLRGGIPFETFNFQKDFVRLIHAERFTHVTHARQMGITTCLAAFVLWSGMYEGEGCVSLIVSRSLSNSIDLMDRIRIMYETLPDHLKIPVKTYNKRHIIFENGNEINAVAPNPDAFRGRTVKHVYVDQMAWISHSIGRDFWTAIQPTLSTAGGRCVLTSSGGDTDGIFYDLARAIPDNGFVRMVIPWYRHPERDEVWARPVRENLGEARFRQDFLCEFMRRP